MCPLCLCGEFLLRIQLTTETQRLHREERSADFSRKAASWLEFVAGPQCPVIKVASRLRVLQKTTCIKNPVIGLKPKVRVDLPSQFHARPVSDKPFATTVCGSNQGAWYGVDSVLQALSPLNNPIEGGSNAMRECQVKLGMKIDEVDGAWACSG